MGRLRVASAYSISFFRSLGLGVRRDRRDESRLPCRESPPTWPLPSPAAFRGGAHNSRALAALRARGATFVSSAGFGAMIPQPSRGSRLSTSLCSGESALGVPHALRASWPRAAASAPLWSLRHGARASLRNSVRQVVGLLASTLSDVTTTNTVAQFVHGSN